MTRVYGWLTFLVLMVILLEPEKQNNRREDQGFYFNLK